MVAAQVSDPGGFVTFGLPEFHFCVSLGIARVCRASGPSREGT
jgi:hypothetical protein